MCYFKFTIFSHVLDFLSKHFGRPRRPYGVLVSKHPDGHAHVFLALSEGFRDGDTHANIVDYAILEPDVARDLAKNIIMIADQIDTFRR